LVESISPAPGIAMSAAKQITRLGLIAGNRTLPLELARQARQQGIECLVAVGFEGETDPGLEPLVDEMVWMKVGQLAKLIAAFRDRGVHHVVMAGQVTPKRLYDVRPDLRAMALLLRLKERNAHTIFGGIADEMLKDGIELIDARPWLRPLMPQPGFSIGPSLSRAQREDVDFGLRMAKEVARLEIGQLVVVKEGTVLAVEAFEGTDRCLARGGEMAGPGGGAVAVKVAKENHDWRFDIPCIGPKTLEVCAAAGVAVLAFEGGKSLLLEPEVCAGMTRKSKTSLVALGETC
jgi:DUF1009 family protein